MVSPLKGEVSVSISGGEYTLVLDFEGLVAAETAYGKPLAHLTMDAQQGFVGALRALLFGALRRHHPDVDMEAAGKLFLADGKAVELGLEAAAKLAYSDDEGDKKPGKALRQRGTNSGRNGARQA